jgi:hypothetical protein
VDSRFEDAAVPGGDFADGLVRGFCFVLADALGAITPESFPVQYA